MHMPSSTPPKYLQIAAELRSRITSGRYPVGSWLPTKSELMKEFTASQNTVDNALNELERDELIEKQQGKRTSVLSDSPAQPAHEQPASRAHLLRVEQALIDLYEALGRDYPHESAEPGGVSEETAHEKPA